MGSSWRGAKSSDSQRVLVPPSRHITTSFQDIVQEFGGDSETSSFKTIAEQLDFITLHDFQVVRRRLKQSFKPFNDAAQHRKADFHDHDATEIDEDEVTFLEDLYALLQAAHFRVLSSQEWQAALSNDFTFTNPMDVAWNAMDSVMLNRFWRTKPEEYKNAASLSDRVLVMHRGIRLSKAKGKFFQEKVDLIVEYLIAEPLQRLLKPYLDQYKVEWKNYYPTISVVESKGSGYHRGKKSESVTFPPKAPSARDPLLDHENARWVKRITLKDLMPDTASVFDHLFKEIEIQEPTFKDAIILYRRGLESKEGKQDKSPKSCDAGSSDLKRNIHIKRFQDIPIADLEMIFPDKTVYLKPVLLIQLLITILIGLISVLITIITTEASWSLIFGVLSVIGTRAYQVWNSAQLGRQQVLDQITDRLYDQTMDAQDGVIYFLLDQMADQHVKELLLAYFLLLESPKPLTQGQLDKRCEDHLKHTFRESVDFALENSLPTLLEDGLVTKDSNGLLQPVPLEESQKVLARKGASFFVIPRDKTPQIPTFRKLSNKNLARRSHQAKPNYNFHQHVPSPEPTPSQASTLTNVSPYEGSQTQQKPTVEYESAPQSSTPSETALGSRIVTPTGLQSNDGAIHSTAAEVSPYEKPSVPSQGESTRSSGSGDKEKHGVKTAIKEFFKGN